MPLTPIELADSGSPPTAAGQPIPAAILLQLAIAQAQSHALVVLDAYGRVVLWLGGARSLFGYEAEEMLGETLERLHTADDVRRGDVAWSLDAASAHGEMEDDRWQVRKDGVRVWTSGITTALRDARGRVVGYVKITRDRTDLRAQVESLQTRADESAKLDGSPAVFGTLAHELRNPLGEIANAAYVIGHIPSDDKRVATCVRVITHQVEYMQNVIRDLLETTREVMGKARLHYETFDARTVVDRAAETCDAALRARDQKLDIASHDGVRLEGDPVRLQQALVNLISNSSKFSPPNSPIRIAFATEGTDVVFRVDDDGQGIDSKLLPRVFDLFAQATGEGARAGEGLGLGLGVVKSIVEMHQGSVRADSDGAGKGTRVTMRVPVCRP